MAPRIIKSVYSVLRSPCVENPITIGQSNRSRLEIPPYADLAQKFICTRPCKISKKLYNIQQTQFQRKRRHRIY